MKKYSSINLLLCLLYSLISIKSYSQCTSAPYTASFCDGQRAEFNLTDSDVNNVYHWYRDGDFYDLGYGINGDGRYFVSPNDITGVNSVDFWYGKERGELIGPSSTIPLSGGQDASIGQADYEMKFDAQTNFMLNSISIYSKVNYADPNKSWGFQVRIATAAQVSNPALGQFSSWYSYKFTSSNFEKIDIPVNLLVNAGVGYTIQIKSGNTILNLSATDNMYWYSTGSYSNTTYLTAPSQISVYPQTKSVYSTNRYPLIEDWDITLYCSKIKATATKRIIGCCTPAGSNFQVTSPINVARDSDFPMTLKVTGPDALPNSYYLWYDERKNLVPGSEGQGNTSLVISKPGTYYVRIVENQTFKNSYSCYKENSKLVQRRILFAKADKTDLCLGEQTNLIASGATTGITWTPASSLNSSTGKVVVATPSTEGNTLYTVTATVPVGNIVVDGDFDESTYSAPKFESKYNLAASVPSSSPNNYASIGPRASADWGGTWAKFCDDTVGFYTADRGRFLYADAASANGAIPSDWGTKNYLWQQSNLRVFPNTNYEFRFLVTDWGVENLSDPNKTADIQMYVNGIPQLNIPFEVKKRCSWTEVKATWNSGNNTSVKLTIADVNAQNFGGEFAIDDISFGAPGTQQDTVTIKTKNCFYIKANKIGTCVGDSVEIEATTNGLFTGWTHDDGTAFKTKEINNSKSLTTWVHPKISTVYRATASFQLGNLINNGDFEKGNTGFTSDYQYLASNINPGQYSVSTNPYLNDQSFFVNKKDHTSGSGNMLVVDGSNDVTKFVYKNTVSVVSGKQYAFSLWIANVHNEFTKPAPDTNQAKTSYLGFVINGQPLGSIKLPLDTSWVQFYTTYTATTTGTISFGIINNEKSQGGNDFVIDDLAFSPIYSSQLTDKISVPACVTCNKPTSVDLKETKLQATKCESNSLDLTGEFKNAGGAIANGGQYFAWFKQGTVPSAITYSKLSPDPSGTGVIPIPANKSFGSIALTDTGKWILRVEDGNLGNSACYTEDTVTVIVKPLPAKPTTKDTSVCINATNARVIAKPTVAGNTLKWYNAAGTAAISDPNTTLDVTSAGAQTFQVSQVTSSANGSCEGPKATVKLTVVALPVVVANASKKLICPGDPVTLSGSGATNYTWDNGVTNAVAFKPTNKKLYSVTGTDAAGCFNKDTVTIKILTPPTVTANANKATICPSTQVTLTGAGASTYSWDNGVTNGTAFTPTATTTYTVIGTDPNGCKDTATTLVTLAALPTGSISGTNLQFCGSPNTTNNKATITITFTGTPPFDFSYNGSGTTGTKSVVNHPSKTFIFNPTTAETFTLTALKETNGCTSTSMTGSAVTSQFVDPVQVGTPTLTCDPANPTGGAPGVYKFKIEFTGNLGDAGTYVIAAKDQTNITVIGSFTGSKWTSEYINENQSVSLSFTDKNNCNPVLVGPLNKKCSCPETAALSVVSGKDSICQAGSVAATTTQINITTAANGSGASSFTYDILDVDGTSKIGDQTSFFPLNVSKVGTYTIKNFKGTCEGSTIPVTVKALPSPIVKISGKDSFCLDGTSKGNLAIAVTSSTGKSPYNLVLNDGSADLAPISMPNDNYIFNSLTAGTYTIKSITDKNNCTAKPADISGTGTLEGIPKPVAIIELPESVTSPGNKDHTFNAPSVFIKATSPGAGYNGKWAVSPVGASKGTPGFKSGSTTLLTDSVTGMQFDDKATLTWTVTDANSKCPAAVATINLNRQNATVANVSDDSLCVSGIGSYILKGNGLINKEQGSWKLLSPAGAATITADATKDGKEASISGLVIPANTGKVELSIEYTVTPDPTIIGAKITTDVMKLTVYELAEQATATNKTTCSNQVQLTGNDPLKQPTAKGLWTTDKGVLTDATKGNTNLTNLVAGSVSNLVWTISNHLCPATTAPMTVTQAGQMTAPTVSINGGTFVNKDITAGTADPLCVATAYTLTGSTPNPLKNETGAWMISSPGTTGITVAGTNPVQSVTANAEGTTKITWTISPDPTIPGCLPESTEITLVSHDKPTGGTITGNDFQCEGSDSLYKISPLAGSTLPVTYTWGAGTNPGAFRTGAATGEATKYRIYSDASGGTTQGTITATASNACGSTPLTDKTVGIRLAPRALSPAVPSDTIAGPSAFCASSGGASYILTGRPDVQTFSWSWDNTTPVKTTNSTTDSAVISQSSHWDPLAKTDKVYTLKVDLTNHCSDTAKKNGILPLSKTKQVKVFAPVEVKVLLKATPQFCMPDQPVPFDADSITTLPGLKRSYEFSVISAGVPTVLQTGTSDKYLAPAGSLKDGDVVKVTLIPDAVPKQCIAYTNPVDSKVMEGFDYPPSDIQNLTPVICENNPNGITLRVDQKATSKGSRWDNRDIRWFNGTTPMPKFDGKFEITLRSVAESGNYTVTVGSNPLGCATHVSNTALAATTRIYEKPEATVLVNPFPVPYTEGVNIYHMPVIVTKPIQDTLTKNEYFPGTWLADPKNPTTLLVPEKKEQEITYILTLETGKGVCLTQVPVTVVYFLQLDIPNAFTPNGDGLNDEWVITGLGKYPNTSVKVFNRWGSSMFVDNDGYKAVWNGMHNGQPLPAGTYYYIIELKGSPDNTDKTETGSLTLVR